MQEQQSEIQETYLKNLGIASFNEMQREVMVRANIASNLMLLAPTGSGKTLAFLMPLLSILQQETGGVLALIITPSRELALQIETVFRSMKTNYKVSCCYGGHSVKIEQNSLLDAPAVIIGTPGRLADHIGRESFDASTIKLVVLDEFDKSLQMGFHEQLKTIFAALSGKQKHILTSATRSVELPDFLPFRKAETIDFLKDEVESKLKLKVVHTNSTDKVDTVMKLVAGFSWSVRAN
jgi:superfamily II DNA/RNA helicase